MALVKIYWKCKGDEETDGKCLVAVPEEDAEKLVTFLNKECKEEIHWLNPNDKTSPTEEEIALGKLLNV